MDRYLNIFLCTLISLLFFVACQNDSKSDGLKIYGEREISGTDTVYHQIPDFTFINQDSQFVTNATFQDKIYVADFFFTSCTTICPRVKKQMMRIYEKYKDNDQILLLSHSIDTKYDTVGRLKRYADEQLGVSADKWHFVTGEKDKIYNIANDYFSVAIEDPTLPDGFDHSGYIILVDKKRRIRSMKNGTLEEEVDQFMEDMDQLLAQQGM